MIAERVLLQLLWERPRFWERMQAQPLTDELIARGRAFDAVAWLEAKAIPSESWTEGEMRGVADTLIHEHGIMTHLAVASLASAFLDLPRVALTLVWTVDADRLISTYVQTYLALEDLELPRGILETAAEVYLTKVLEQICGSQLKFPERATVFLLKCDPRDGLSFTFSPPEWSSPEVFNKEVEQWLSNARKEIRKKYLDPVLGREIKKLESTLQRNALWLYENRVEGRSIAAIAREEFDADDRRGEVRDAIESVVADLTFLDGEGG